MAHITPHERVFIDQVLLIFICSWVVINFATFFVETLLVKPSDCMALAGLLGTVIVGAQMLMSFACGWLYRTAGVGWMVWSAPLLVTIMALMHAHVRPSMLRFDDSILCYGTALFNYNIAVIYLCVAIACETLLCKDASNE